MDYETILLKREQQILTITLNRPQKLNSQSDQLAKELGDVVEGLRDDDNTKFVIITGAGKAFSVGADVTEAQSQASQGQQFFRASLRRRNKFLNHLISSIENLEQITIAALNGFTVGGGLGLALTCDFRIAVREAVISIPETYVGMFFAFGSTPRLVNLIGPSRAKELIMTGDSIDAEEALKLGLVNKVVDATDLLPACYRFIDKIAARAPLATRLTKTIVNAVSTPALGAINLYEPDLMDRFSLSHDRMEALQAFAENKRKPRFTGE